MPNDDNDVVHRHENERILGVKSFLNTPVVRNSNLAKGTAPTHEQNMHISFCDNSTIEWSLTETHGRFGLIETYVYPDGNVDMKIGTYKNALNDHDMSAINVGWSSDGTSYAKAPSTLPNRTNGTDILTRDWIPQDTRIVHSTGDETVGGIKTFTGDGFSYKKASPYFLIINTGANYQSLPTAGQYSGINFTEKNEKVINRTQVWINTDGSTGWATSCKAFDNMNTSTYSATFALYLNKDATSKVAAVSNVNIFRPDVNNYTTLGGSSNRWKEVWTNASAINSSDERMKTSIESFSDDVLDAWGDVEFCRFKFNDAVEEKGIANARIHGGLVAQRVDKVFKKHNLDISKYGLFCYDEWDSEPEVRDEEGGIIHGSIEAGNQYSIRYTEALCMEAAYQRRRASRAEARITELEQRLNSLEEKLVGKD